LWVIADYKDGQYQVQTVPIFYKEKGREGEKGAKPKGVRPDTVSKKGGSMKFNFPLFRGFANIAYNRAVESGKEIRGAFINNLFSLDNTLMVFEQYFSTYELYMKRPHPPIKVSQIEQIIKAMSFIDVGGIDTELDPGTYEDLIDKHFQTEYNVGMGGCDYNINHFFSGNIRALRFFEVCYRGDDDD
jgi:hypothetical protein